MKNGSSPAELERQAEQERARIAETAEALRERLTPGQLIDEMMDYFRHSDASAMLHNFKGQVRDNPIALAMVGAGMAWLMTGKGYKGRSRANGHEGRSDYDDELYNQAELFGYDGRAHASREGGTYGRSEASVYGESASADDGPGIGERLSEAGETIRDAGDRARAAARSAGTRASGFAHSASESAARTAHDLRREAERYGRRSGEMFADLLEREPLIVGALGVAIGAAIGAALPSTELEDEYLGPTRDRLKDDAAETLEKGMEKAKDIAGRATEAAREEADAQGLTPGDKPIADKVASVARAAADEVKESMPHGKDGGGTSTT
jgi:hypothetical protein